MDSATQQPDNPETKASVLSKPPQDLVPALSKETWEYLELKLWSAFSKKIWTLTASILTVAGLFALLGVDSVLKSRVESALKDQAQLYERARQEQEKRMQAQLMSGGMVFVLQDRLLQDAGQYWRAVQKFRESLDSEKKKHLDSVREFDALLDPQYFYSFPNKAEFDKRLKALPASEYGKGFIEDRNSIRAQLESLRRQMSHLHALQVALKEARKGLFTSAGTNPNDLTEYYESTIYPKYLEKLREHSDSEMWASAGTGAVNSLVPEGRQELRFFVPNIYERLFK
jgi:hypothetical protein